MSNPYDPNDPRPETRRMEPYQPDPNQTGHYEVDPHAIQPAAYEPTGAYQPTGAYNYDDEYAQQYADEYEPAPTAKPDGSRTAMLALIAVLAAAILLLVGFLVYQGVNNGNDEATPVPGSSTTEETPSTTSSTTSSSSSTSSTSSTPEQAPGLITYHLTGEGALAGLRYTTDGGDRIVATARTPWTSSSVLEPGSQARLTAIVTQGQVTCNILIGQQIIGTVTSGIGPLNCSATVPAKSEE